MLGALDVVAHQPHRPRGVAAAKQPHQAPVLVVGAGEHLLGMGDQRDQVAHLALDLGHRRHQVGRAGGLGDADVKADVGAAVVLELGRIRHLLDQLVEAVELLGVGALGRQDRRTGLDRDAVVEHRPRRLAERLALAP